MAFTGVPEQLSSVATKGHIYQSRYPVDFSHLSKRPGKKRETEARPYRGIPVGCSYCVYECTRPGAGLPSNCPEVTPAKLVVGIGREARLLCHEHARLGTWRR